MGAHRKTESRPVQPVPVFDWRKPNVKFSAWTEARIHKSLSRFLEQHGLSRSPLLVQPVHDFAAVQYELLSIQDEMAGADFDDRQGLRAAKIQWIRLSDQLWKRIAAGGELRQPRLSENRPTPIPLPQDRAKVTPIRSRWETPD